jgi:2'-5' RNA ligase
MRLFVGIELGDSLAKTVDGAVTRLRSDLLQSCPDFSATWVKRANLHLTLVFIGDVSDERLPELRGVLGPVCGVGRFDLRVAGFGAFPPTGPLRVIWMGIVEGARELSLLHDEVGARLQRIGRDAEARPYAPHLTVARVKRGSGAAAPRIRQVVQTAAAPGGRVTVAAVTLFRSHLAPSGSTYEAVMRVPLLA